MEKGGTKPQSFVCEWGETEGRLLGSRTSVLPILMSEQVEGSTRVCIYCTRFCFPSSFHYENNFFSHQNNA